jgi:hypothetical protein
MATALVAVASSENEFTFAVIDFTNPNSPVVTQVTPSYNDNTHLGADGSTVVAGAYNGSRFVVVDITDPANPVEKASVNLNFGGISAVAVKGNRAALGERNGFRIAFVDLTNLSAPVVLGTATSALNNFNSLAFISPSVVVGAGPNNFECVRVDFTNPNSPVVSTFTPAAISLAPTLDADSGASRILVGDTGGPGLQLLDASQTQLQSVNTPVGQVQSASLAFPLAIVASQNSFTAARVNFSSNPGVVTGFNPNLGGGSVTAINGTKAALGAILGTNVALVNLAANPPAVVGTANSTLASIATLNLVTYNAVVSAGAKITVTPLSLLFAFVKVNTAKSLTLAVSNTGNAPLTVAIASSNAAVTATPANFTVNAGNSQTVTVKFQPTAAGAVNGNLTLTTNDPNNPTVSIPFSGTGAFPQIVVTVANLNLGNAAVCQSSTAPLQIQNTGQVPLSVTSLAATGPFSVSPANTTVNAGATQTVTVKFTPTTTGGATGTLTITSDDPTKPTIPVVLQGNGLPMPPPAINVTPTTLTFGLTPVMYFIGLRITIANTGPCKVLNVTLTSASAPFFVTDTDPTALPPNSLSVSGSVNAGSSKRFVVVFAPQAAGAANGTLTITSDDPNNPTIAVPLTGTGVQPDTAALELVLDRSGSMSDPAQGGTKMDALKQSVHLLADLLIPGQGDQMGSVQFDDQFAQLTALAAFDGTQQGQIETDVDTLTPRGSTSIGGGLQLGQTQLGGATANRKIILVFTDGMENTDPRIATVEPGILAAGTEVYAVGLGDPAYISTAALGQLAATSNGKFFNPDDALVLRKNFVQVLADAFRQNMAADPIFQIFQKQQVDLPVSITNCERRLGFVLCWDDPAAQLDLSVSAPDGTLYTRHTAPYNSLVRYGQQPTFRYLEIAFPPIDPGSGLAIGPQRLGQWVMHVRAIELPGNSERCTTGVVVESDLTMRTSFLAEDVYHPMLVRCQILEHGQPVVDAHVVANLTLPPMSLAKSMTPAVVKAALNADHHHLERHKPRSGKIKKLKLHHSREGFYEARLPAPKIDGVYGIEIHAGGKACGGNFERYASFARYVGRREDPRKTRIQVKRLGPVGALVTVTPKDARGVDLGAGRQGSISAKIEGGRVLQVRDLLNGSYELHVVWGAKLRNPIVHVMVGAAQIRVKIPAAKKSKAR